MSWPSGLRRQFKALVFTGAGSNPADIKKTRTMSNFTVAVVVSFLCSSFSPFFLTGSYLVALRVLPRCRVYFWRTNRHDDYYVRLFECIVILALAWRELGNFTARPAHTAAVHAARHSHTIGTSAQASTRGAAVPPIEAPSFVRAPAAPLCSSPTRPRARVARVWVCSVVASTL